MSIIPSVTDLPRTIVFLNKPRSDSGVQDLEFDVATTPPTSPAIPSSLHDGNDISYASDWVNVYSKYRRFRFGNFLRRCWFGKRRPAPRKPDIVDAEVVRDSAVSLTEFVPVVVAPSQVLSAPSTSIIGPVTTGDSLIVDIPPSALDLTNTDRVEKSALPATITIPTSNAFSVLDNISPAPATPITPITSRDLTETVHHIVSAILDPTHDEIPSSSESDFASSDESDQLTTDDSDESIEPDVVVPLSIEAVLGNARKQLAASARVLQEFAVVPDDSPYESPAESPLPVRTISVTRANLTGLKSSLARHAHPRRSSKSVRFNHLQFQEVCVFRRGIKAQDIPTCPRFIQSIHDMEAAEREEREAYEALTPASVPAVTLRPSNFSYNELSRLDPSCPLRVEKVVMNSRDPVPAPTILVQVRVANWGTPKQLTIRYSLDDWATFAETTESDCRWGGFVEGTECGEERFGVELRGQGRAGSSIKFAVRYSVNDCVFWDSNAGRDYQVSVSKPAPLTTTTRTRLPPPCSGSIDGFLIDPIIPDSPPRPRRQRSQSTLPPLKRTDTDPLPLRSPFSARYSFGEGRRGVRLDGRRGGLFGSEDC
ncbi:hypothetical protein DFS34DRAFT_607083 [Phlyctochytrium arcticum]|nr:hypothetical protein DFS34DRAFT_607083 [Phlyctochytrium arcticum]